MKGFVLRVLGAATALTGLVVVAAVAIADYRDGQGSAPVDDLAGAPRVELLAHNEAPMPVELWVRVSD